jgi:hypothetical protein
MDKAICIPSILLAIVLIALYVFRCRQQRKELNIGVIVNSILGASGLVCASFLIAGSVFERVMQYVSGVNLYIFIAGTTLLFVSGQSVYRDVIRKEGKSN